MVDDHRSFAVASDERLIHLIERAQNRLVVVCPALTDSVAAALTKRLGHEGVLDMAVILDADPEVYRLGYGSEAALGKLRAAADKKHFGLRVQDGVRIGLIISDEVMMIFSPVPKFIEAGSTSLEKPNAIIVSGVAIDRIAEAAGVGPADRAGSQEVGIKALTPNQVQALTDDLKSNPPQPFDITRALRVFSSKVQYVELKVENYRFSSRQVVLPPELLDITDEGLKGRISGRVRAPTQVSGPFEISAETSKGEAKIQADEKWLSGERKRIEDAYTFPIPHIGRVMLNTDRQAFDGEIEQFKRNLKKYHLAVLAALAKVKKDFEETLVKGYLPKWKGNPPASFKRYGLPPTDENLERQLRAVVDDLSHKAISFEEPWVRVIYKSIAPESVRDPEFIEPLKKIMQRRSVPVAIIESLFASGDAAPATSEAKGI
jgi:hypothetical protein